MHLWRQLVFLVRIFYQVYCHRNFTEARYNWALRKDLLKELGRFAGVTTLSGILQTIVGEGLVLVINLTFGAALNAVYVIALQLKNSILSFAMNVYKAVSPQITKTYASGEMEHHKMLVYTGSKMAVYMLYLIFFPFFIPSRLHYASVAGQSATIYYRIRPGNSIYIINVCSF